jgi:Transposase DDE domain/Transposase domain (DUF772)
LPRSIAFDLLRRMTLGKAPTSEDVFRSGTEFCRDRVSATSIYGLLYRESHRLFPDEAFADLFADIGRASVPPRIVAVVMVLQRLEGLSDREAVDRVTFDLRWKYAAGGLDFDYAGFVHTVLVDMRARLRRSERPNRIFETALEVAREAGLVGRKRVLDSTALYDAVATQDTVTMIRSAIRALLRIVDEKLGAELRSCCKRDDDYVAPGKPSCDWDDVQAREALVDTLARDAYAVLAALDGRTLTSEVAQAAKLVATVVGQDLEQRDDGRFRIARRVAKDRVISTVDPEARHGHKTAARGFDGYKGHLAIDPDSEIITATTVTAGNVADGEVAEELTKDVLVEVPAAASSDGAAQSKTVAPVEIYGDSSYGTAKFVEAIESAGAEANVKVQPPSAPEGKFTKDAFDVDLTTNTVRCPAGALVVIRPRTHSDGLRIANFGVQCNSCPLRSQCTDGKEGRTIRVHPHEATLARSRMLQRAPAWKARYRATRPKVERKISHLMQRRHGGRRARVRGRARVTHDFALLGAAQNLRRLATLGVHHDGRTWTR